MHSSGTRRLSQGGIFMIATPERNALETRRLGLLSNLLEVSLSMLGTAPRVERRIFCNLETACALSVPADCSGLNASRLIFVFTERVSKAML